MLTRLKIAVFAPMPSASVTIATTVNPGAFISIRSANRRSCIVFSTEGSVWRSRYVSAVCVKPPNATRAARVAFSRVMPARTLSSITRSRCSPISSLKWSRRESANRWAMRASHDRTCLTGGPSNPRDNALADAVRFRPPAPRYRAPVRIGSRGRPSRAGVLAADVRRRASAPGVAAQRGAVAAPRRSSL